MQKKNITTPIVVPNKFRERVGSAIIIKKENGIRLTKNK